MDKILLDNFVYDNWEGEKIYLEPLIHSVGDTIIIHPNSSNRHEGFVSKISSVGGSRFYYVAKRKVIYKNEYIQPSQNADADSTVSIKLLLTEKHISKIRVLKTFD